MYENLDLKKERVKQCLSCLSFSLLTLLFGINWYTEVVTTQIQFQLNLPFFYVWLTQSKHVR